MKIAATPKPGGFDREWAKLDLAPMVMRGKTDLQEASLILMSVKPELLLSGKLQTRTVLRRSQGNARRGRRSIS